MCPVVGREISSGDCGGNRVSRYSCPADCAHNPFAPANYAQLLEIEDELDRKTLEWMFADSTDRPALALAFRRAVGTESPHAAHAFTSWQLFSRIEADGLTCAQHWERAGFPGLTNDERTLFRGKMQMRVNLLEIRRVVDAQRLEVIDLFSPEGARLNVVDRSLAGQAVRFAPFLTWAYPLPHFWRMAGTALLIPDWAPFEPVEIVTELARHLGGPAGDEPLRRWLAEHFVRLDEALAATVRERQRLMVERINAKWGSAVYELRAPFGECRAALDAFADVESDDIEEREMREGFAEARAWLDEADDPVVRLPEGSRLLLGRVLLGRTSWRIEAMGDERLGRLRGKLEARMGARVRFAGERLDDLGARTALEEPQGGSTLVPPRLLDHVSQVRLMSWRMAARHGGSEGEMRADMEQARLRTFGDEPLPALNGRTPREAVRDPGLRPKLVRVMKSFVRGHDENNLRAGRADDINWLLRELGMDELDVPPPPPRPPPGLENPEDVGVTGDDGQLAGGREHESDDDRLEPDPLPDGPFDSDEAAERLNTALEEFDTAAEALDELEASGATLVPDAGELTQGLLSEVEFSYLATFLLQAWFAMVQPGCRAPRLRLPAMREAMQREMDLLVTTAPPASEEALNRIRSGCRQPMVLQMLMERLSESARKMPKHMRLSLEARARMAVVLKVVIDELDHALR